jgi:2,3-bisphosphoglycerate-dependent phosphoglycerate mutase
MTRVILIRHGQTIWNLEKREMGQLDSQLSEKGEMQAKALAKRLENVHFSALYSSDLGRALQTAQYISEISGKVIITDTELRERNMGIFQGYTREEIAKKYPDEWAAHNSPAKFDYVIPNGESQRQRHERSIRAFNRLADNHSEEQIVIVSHAGILRTIFEYVLCLPPGNEGRFKRRNATYNVFCKENEQWSLDVWGDTSHLGSDGLS